MNTGPLVPSNLFSTSFLAQHLKQKSKRTSKLCFASGELARVRSRTAQYSTAEQSRAGLCHRATPRPVAGHHPRAHGISCCKQGWCKAVQCDGTGAYPPTGGPVLFVVASSPGGTSTRPPGRGQGLPRGAAAGNFPRFACRPGSKGIAMMMSNFIHDDPSSRARACLPLFYRFVQNDHFKLNYQNLNYW